MDIDDEDLYGPDAFETPKVITEEQIKSKKTAIEEQSDEPEMEDVYEEDDLEIVVGPTEHKPIQQTSRLVTSRSTEEIGSTAPVMNIHAIGTFDPSATGGDGSLQGAIPIIDADLDDDTLFEDRPWRRPGADPTDYFNFGFDEQSWREYCTKQKALREEQATKKRIGLVMEGSNVGGMAKGLHLGPGNLPTMLPGMLPPLPTFLPPPPPWILQQGQQSRDRSREREYRSEHRESTRDTNREHRDRDRGGEHREHHRESTRESTRDRDRGKESHRRDSNEPVKDRSSHRDSRSRHSSRRSASPPTGPSSRTSSSRR